MRQPRVPHVQLQHLLGRATAETRARQIRQWSRTQSQSLGGKRRHVQVPQILILLLAAVKRAGAGATTMAWRAAVHRDLLQRWRGRERGSGAQWLGPPQQLQARSWKIARANGTALPAAP